MFDNRLDSFGNGAASRRTCGIPCAHLEGSRLGSEVADGTKRYGGRLDLLDERICLIRELTDGRARQCLRTLVPGGLLSRSALDSSSRIRKPGRCGLIAPRFLGDSQGVPCSRESRRQSR